MSITKPTFDEEKVMWLKGIEHVAGVDEVGRGCFAGPVVAGAVILPQGFSATDEINDSKLLSAKKREQLDVIIRKHALAYAIAEVPVSVINLIGVGKAAQQAFAQAITQLKILPQHILVDAFYIDSITRAIQKPIIHGDQKSISIAAASIIAKVYRDRRMQELHKDYVDYDFATNKGYGTKKHREAIKKFGLCDLHRTSFNLSRHLN